MAKAPNLPARGFFTHYPQTQGTVCNAYPAPTLASHYDPVAPDCPTCARWLADVKASTAARFGRQVMPPTPPPEPEKKPPEAP
jgi:hypothetical protein